MPKAIKERKRVTKRVITIDDIKNVIKAILKKDYERRLKLNFVAMVLFGAYTGQRPYTIKKLETEQFEKALEKELPVLLIEAKQDKIRMEHYVPLHPKLIPFLQAVLKDREKEKFFEYMAFENHLKRDLRVRLLRAEELKEEKRHFVIGDLRKFAEQHGDIIKWDQSNKNYIMTHNVSGIDWERYKSPLPEYVYMNYLEAWKDVDLVPEEAYELLE